MTFKSATWYPIAVVLSGVNGVGAWFYATQGEQPHAAVHLALAIGFGLWAQRIRPRSGGGGGELRTRSDAPEGVQSQFEALELEISKLQRELTETQERLDFVERMLAQGRETPRVGPQR